MNRTSLSRSEGTGLFNIIYDAGIVRDLGLENVDVFADDGEIGGLVGENRGKIFDSYVTGEVSGWSRSYVRGSVWSERYLGISGLAGANRGTIRSSHSAANVEVTVARKGWNIGGLVGYNVYGSIEASYATGTVSGNGAEAVGGLSGANDVALIAASYATGAVSSPGGRYIGGLVGSYNTGTWPTPAKRIRSSYSLGSATTAEGTYYPGGVVGVVFSWGGVGPGYLYSYWDTDASGNHGGKTTSELQSPTGYTGIYANWNEDLDGDGNGDDPWDFGTSCQYPVLKYGGLDPDAQRSSGTPASSVKTKPVVARHLDDVSGLAIGSTQGVTLCGVFSDADGDALTITASSSDETIATVSVSSDGTMLTLEGVSEGTATITVTAQDGDGNQVSDEFDVTVVAKYTALIAQMYQWRNDPQWVSEKAHTDRWDRVLLAFGETVSDATLTPMTAAEAQAFADRGSAWSRWLEVAPALRELESGGQPQQGTPNQAPTVSSALGDVIIVNESGTRRASLSGVFDDADNDALTITAASSDDAKATVSVASNQSSLTVNAQARGTATITVTADDGNDGTVDDTFTVTVKAAPAVSSALADVSGLEVEATQEVSLSGAFSDADGDALTITAQSSDETKATVSVASDGSSLTLAGVSEGTATITVTAQDSDSNRVSDAFDVSVVAKYTALIAQIYQWRNDPQWVGDKAHTDRWDRVLLTFGETVSDATLTRMTAAEAQALADQSWGERWVPVAAALREIEATRPRQQPNQAPTVSAAIADATIVKESGTRTVSLSSVFSDADNDALTITAASSNDAVATVSVASDGSSLTLTAKSRGTATITVTAADGNGGTVDDTFTVTVKAATVVASTIADVSGLEAGTTQQVSLAGVFSDADGDALTITAASDDEAVATVSVASDSSALTVTGAGEGTATITVTARDTDGNRVSDAFSVSVSRAAELDPAPTPETETETSDIASRYDADGDGGISHSEMQKALDDYYAGRITSAELLEVHKAYAASYARS